MRIIKELVQALEASVKEFIQSRELLIENAKLQKATNDLLREMALKLEEGNTITKDLMAEIGDKLQRMQDISFAKLNKDTQRAKDMEPTSHDMTY